MRYADFLRKRFPGIKLRGKDLFPREAFQIKYLPDRVPVREFAIFLHANPMVQNFLTLKYPPIVEYIRSVLSDHPPAGSDEILERSMNDLLWEIADLINYNKYPEVYDEKSEILWDTSELCSISSLQGKTIVDAGENPMHETLVSPEWDYTFKGSAFEEGMKRMYYKEVNAHEVS